MFVSSVSLNALEVMKVELAEPNSRRLEIGVDSCAAVSVMPPEQCENYPLVQDGKKATYYTATRGRVPDRGQRHVVGGAWTTGGSRAKLHAAFRVGPGLTRALMAVGEMVEKGMRVVFDKEYGRDVSEITIKQTGE